MRSFNDTGSSVVESSQFCRKLVTIFYSRPESSSNFSMEDWLIREFKIMEDICTPFLNFFIVNQQTSKQEILFRSLLDFTQRVIVEKLFKSIRKCFPSSNFMTNCTHRKFGIQPLGQSQNVHITELAVGPKGHVLTLNCIYFL